MARWRKLGMGLWSSPSFLSLSPVKPSGRSLFIHLCVGPHTLALPGISHIGEAAMAEDLGWSLSAFRRSFHEIVSAGMAEADWASRVVVVWKALQNCPPENEKVLIGWAKSWELIPECDLKARYYRHILEFLETYDQTYGHTYTNTFSQRFRKPYGNTSAIQYGNKGAGVGAGAGSPPCEGPPPRGGAHAIAYPEAFEEFWRGYPRRVGKGKTFESWRKATKLVSNEELLAALAVNRNENPNWADGIIPNPATWLNQRRWEDDLSSLSRGRSYAGKINPGTQTALNVLESIRRRRAERESGSGRGGLD